MSLFFRPTVPLYYKFAQGRTEPYSAYLVCGPEASGYCLGRYDLVVHVPAKRVVPFPELAFDYHRAIYDFDCLTFFSSEDPLLQVAFADTRLIKANECFNLFDLFAEVSSSYEPYLHRVMSA